MQALHRVVGMGLGERFGISALIALLSASLSVPVRSASACGWGGPSWSPASENTEATLGAFVAGDLGLIAPQWRGGYLVVSYRWLQGAPIPAPDQEALRLDWQSGPAYQGSAARRWTTARNLVAGTTIDAPATHRQRDYSYYLNCPDDAFDMATATLAQRTQQYASRPDLVSEWIRGQDAVFANCGGGSSIPRVLGSDVSLARRRDRAYQIAAANFYTGNFAEARKGFDAIAGDEASVWQPVAGYLSVRSLVREASLGGLDVPALHQEALGRLSIILSDPAQAGMHGASRNLQALVRYRVDPVAQLERLAHDIEKSETHHRLATTTKDLIHGLRARDPATLAALRQRSDLIDWLRTFRDPATEAYAHAHAQFGKHGSHAWLVAALTMATPASPGLELLLAAADSVGVDAPAFASVRFHQVRLLSAGPERKRAQRLLAEALSTPMPEATGNAFSALALSQAATFKDWQEHALRYENSKPVLHGDARASIRERFSLSMMLELAGMPGLVPATSREILMAAFVRAIVLGKQAMARRAASALMPLAPELEDDLRVFLDSKPRHRLGVGALVVLRHEYQFGEPSYRQALSNYEQSCRPALFCETSGPTYTSIVEIPGQTSSVGRDTESKTAAALGTRLDGLGRQVQRFARSAPNHPLVPETLHRLVQATRRASMHFAATPKTGELSKNSFQLLQRKYKGNLWTQKTRYWYR